MKFYYKGQLIRSSKTHTYTHAVIIEDENGNIGKCGCSSSLALAEKLCEQVRAKINPSAKVVPLEAK